MSAPSAKKPCQPNTHYRSTWTCTQVLSTHAFGQTIDFVCLFLVVWLLFHQYLAHLNRVWFGSWAHLSPQIPSLWPATLRMKVLIQLDIFCEIIVRRSQNSEKEKKKEFTIARGKISESQEIIFYKSIFIYWPSLEFTQRLVNILKLFEAMTFPQFFR